MKYCKWCGSTVTRLDEYGYCKKYWCFGRAGKDKVLEALKKRISDLYFLPKSAQLGITSYVTNNYNPRTREANNILMDAQKEFGFVPLEIIDKIPMENRGQWDKNIKW